MFVLENLWSGDLGPIKEIQHNQQRSEVLSRSNNAAGKLDQQLSPELKECFEEYLDSQADVEAVTDCEAFIAGFRFGALLMLDILCPGKMKEL